MELHISIREANQYLSRYVHKVEQGDDVIITRRGAPVAKLVKIGEAAQLTEAKQAARERMRHRLREGYALGGEVWDRDAIYDRL